MNWIATRHEPPDGLLREALFLQYPLDGGAMLRIHGDEQSTARLRVSQHEHALHA